MAISQVLGALLLVVAGAAAGVWGTMHVARLALGGMLDDVGAIVRAAAAQTGLPAAEGEALWGRILAAARARGARRRRLRAEDRPHA